LKAGGIVKSQFGSSRITRAKESGDIISPADDLKAAATDALKKAATLLGVGLHLYRNDRPKGEYHQSGYQRDKGYRNNGGNGNGNNHPAGGNRNGGNGSSPYRGKSNGNGNGNENNQPYRSDGNGNGNGGNGNGRLTNNQYKYMLNLNQEKGRSKADLDKYCLQMFGAASEYLSKNDASSVIKQLMAH
jgi:hypothetical protein